MSDATAAQLPPGLAAVAADFADTPREMRLELLLEYADRLKPLPEPYASQTDLMNVLRSVSHHSLPLQR